MSQTYDLYVERARAAEAAAEETALVNVREREMRSAVLTEKGKPLEIVEREVPEPGPGEILVRVTACGMCFSEVGLVHGNYPFARFPTVPGHEISGVVEALGPGVEWPEPGTPVGGQWIYGSCGRCDQCVRGDQILCTGAPRRVTGVTDDRFDPPKARTTNCRFSPGASSTVRVGGFSSWNGLGSLFGA